MSIPTSEVLDAIGPSITRYPTVRPTDAASVHIQRSQWARKSERTVSQRRNCDGAREAVALAIAARTWPTRWGASELARHTGYSVLEVEQTLASMEHEGLIIQPATGCIDVLTTALLDRLKGATA